MQNLKHTFKPKRVLAGFTLIELMVVISIISLLSSIVLAGTSGALIKTRDARRSSDVYEIRNALALYQLDHNGALPNVTGTCTLGNACYCVGIATYNPLDPSVPYSGYCWDVKDNSGFPTSSTLAAPGDINIDNALRPYMSSLPRDPNHNEGTVMADGYIINIDDHLTGTYLGPTVYSLDWGLEGCYLQPGATPVKYSNVCAGGTLVAFSTADTRPFLGACKNFCVLPLSN